MIALDFTVISYQSIGILMVDINTKKMECYTNINWHWLYL